MFFMKSFVNEAQRILNLQPAYIVRDTDGYGPDGEVIYQSHPFGCPSVLVDSQGNGTVQFLSNGSIEFKVKTHTGLEVYVLESSFDPVEKRETGVPSNNAWLVLKLASKKYEKHRTIVSIINPYHCMSSVNISGKVVKIGYPSRAMWFCHEILLPDSNKLRTAIKFSLHANEIGLALFRQIYLEYIGRRELLGSVWTYFHTRGTQRFVYNKPLWYDAGRVINKNEIVVTATIPYSSSIQIKRISSAVSGNIKPTASTCDYTSFIGSSEFSAILPHAVLTDKLLNPSTNKRLNRFSTPTVAATKFDFELTSSKHAVIQQALLYITKPELEEMFRTISTTTQPDYRGIERAFTSASKKLISITGTVRKLITEQSRDKVANFPPFHIVLPNNEIVANYVNSVWMGVRELYENCRAHGAKLADGIEIGTRDRAQDMWSMMKEDPARVKADLIHAYSFMYITADDDALKQKPLTLPAKLHGMFPRQYPSQWLDRTIEIANDNRPYADSAIWLVDALNKYISETGDISILLETVKTVTLTEPAHPETSRLKGCKETFRIAEVVREIFLSYSRHIADSPYGLAQVLYGDWCDPVDMFGTSIVGDPKTRGWGRGAHVRLSAHIFLSLIETIDIFSSSQVDRLLRKNGINFDIKFFHEIANKLRQNIMRVAFEAMPNTEQSGFIDCIHELKKDSTHPDYANGEIGYTLGSVRGTDFDGFPRRILPVQAFCIKMLNTKRSYLEEIHDADEIILMVLKMVDKMFYRKELGLLLITPPVANSMESQTLVGRMGVLPCGCAENGEYHHGQMFMHTARLEIDGETNKVWQQFLPMLSVMRGREIAGPFETPCTSYCSDANDPHFGKGMYFGLSGSVDWLIEFIENVVGLELKLYETDAPIIKLSPRLPSKLSDGIIYHRIIHVHNKQSDYHKVQLTVKIRRAIEKEKPELRIKADGSKEINNNLTLLRLREIKKLEMTVIL